jgi:protease II
MSRRAFLPALLPLQLRAPVAAALGSKTTSEIWALDANQPHLDFTCLAPRVEGHEYDVDHGQLDGEWTWFIRSNRDGINFALYVAADTGQCRPKPTGRT